MTFFEPHIVRASTAADGTQANADCYVPSLSGDGARLAFQGYAYNLVADDTNSAADIFVKDLASGAVTRASTGSDGSQANGFSYFPSLSHDGSAVAFYSHASNLVAGDTNGVADVFLKNLSTGALTLVSASSAGTRGNGDSTYLSLSGHGSHVAFMSEATNLVAGDGNGIADIFVKDLVSGILTRVSVSATGAEANAACYEPTLSDDGGTVAFFSTASSLVAGDSNGTWDIFVKDLATGAVTRASTASDGSQANGYSYDSWLSGDGQTVAFVSHATNLVAGDSNGVADIFVKDLATGALTRVSTASDGTQANGDSGNPVLSADGTKVVFHSYASNLVTGDVNGASDIFVKDLLTGALTRIAEDPSSDGLSLSADGLHVGFHSSVPTLVSGDTNNRWDVFVADLSGATQPPPSDNRPPVVQPDKTLTVAEDSGATPLALTRPTDPDGDALAISVVAVPAMGLGDVFLADGTTAIVAGQTLTAAQLEGLLFRPAADTNGVAGGFSYTVSDGKGGRVSGTVSLAITPVNDTPGGVADAYQATAGTPLVVTAAAGLLANDQDVDGDALTALLAQGPTHGTVSLAADGSFVYTPTAGFLGADSFTYTAHDGVAASQPVTVSLDVRSAGEMAIVRASTAADGMQANADCYVPSLSGDGARLAFQGYAYNLVADDTNSAADIFVKDLASGAVTRASTGSDGSQANGFSYFPSLSHDGSAVAFYSHASNLVAGDTNGVADVFLKNLSTGALTLVSASSAGTRGNGDSTYLSLSGHGSHVAFMSEATNLVAGDGNGIADIFVKDLVSGILTRVSVSATGAEANAACYEPTLSDDGGTVAFFSTASSLVAGDSNGTWDIFVKDLATGAVTRASTASDGSQANGYSYDSWLSGDGQTVAFVSHATNLVAGDSNGVADIFVKDLATGALTRVSTASDGTQANGDSGNPVLSADGTKVVFHSYASNLVTGDVNGASDIFVKDLLTGALTRIAEDPSSDGLSLSADGLHVGFHSSVPTLVSGDTNNRWDVFVAGLMGV